jgi:hypothetical protein
MNATPKDDSNANVIECLAELLVSTHDGLANLRVTEAIAEAMRTGCVVDIGSA